MAMVKIGKVQRLPVTEIGERGIYFNHFLLAKIEAPQPVKIGDQLEVFAYIDPEGQPVATVTKPRLTVGEVGILTVMEVTRFGAFLDWGLPKDLLLPVKDQVGKVKKGDSCLVGLYLNNHNKTAATMRIYDLLITDTPYRRNDRATGTVYHINKEYGVFVAVDNKYHGLIPRDEVYRRFNIGDSVEVRIKRVAKDGKLELSLREEAHKAIEGDAQKIMQKLALNKGTLALNDKSPPAKIKAELNISKRAFKRAAGRLLKEGAIKFTDDGIELTWKNDQ